MKESNVNRLIERGREFKGGLAVIIFGNKAHRAPETVKFVRPLFGGTKGAQICFANGEAITLSDNKCRGSERSGRIRFDHRGKHGVYVTLIPAGHPRVMAMAA